MREAAVVVREDALGQRRLVAYAVGADEDALRAFARQRLPEHMVPSTFVMMESLPMTPSGKVDRRALPAPESDAGDGGYVPPATQTEALLADVRADVPGVEQVGAGAARLAEEEESAGALERAARRARGGAEDEADEVDYEAEAQVFAPNADAIVRRSEDGPAPLSFAQERLWLIEQLQPGTGAYTVATGLRIRGALDARALARALAEVARRHAPLRTRLVEEGGSAAQVIDPPGEVPLPLLDLSAQAAEDREEMLRAHAAAEAARPFHLAEEVPLRARLVRLAGDDHALLLFIHHTAVDGWSLSILFRELDALYGAFGRGEASPLTPLPIRYADYAAWQHDTLRGPALDRELDWWRERLEGLPEVLELPTDRPRPATRTQRGGTHRITLPRTLVEGLRGLAQREGATLFMALLAGFQALLHRYTGDRDFAVGTPVAGRTRPETEGLVGLFVNTLVVRADLSGDPDVRTLLRRVREAALGAWAHQDVPFERLVDALASGRSLGHNPLFQVMFALQNAGDLRPRLDGLDVERIGVHGGGALFDLTWSMVETEEGISGVVEYAADLFDAATVARMADHFRTLLEAATADPDARVSALPMVSAAGRKTLLGAWSGLDTPAPRKTIGPLFAARAKAAPDAVALEWGDDSLSYAALDARATRLARHLRRLGVGHGTRVGICLERGPEMVAATLATLRAGGAYVPLDPAYPAERLAFMLADTAVPVLVADEKTVRGLPPHDARTLLLDRDADAVAAESAEPLEEWAGPESVACVMYTSGSTGTPRGIEVPHRAIVRLVRGADFLDVTASDVFLQMAPAAFDAATLEIWAPLLNGARLALYPPERPTVEGIAAAVARHGVTTLWLTAGLFHLVVEENIQALRGVRRLLAGGDVLSVPHVRRVLAELPGTVVINGYGPTENTTFTACNRVERLAEDAGSVPIGGPISGTRVYVLDAAMEPVPVGVPGQLYAGGAGLAHGYLGRPARTAETFVPHPFGDGERLYATGDRVRWRPDGTLEFLGRIDQQVKIRGFRVEPGEVEAALLAHPDVREGAVAVHTGERGEKRLVAYAAGTVETDALLAWLRARLPEHMVPSAVVRMEAMPLTASGKVDRRALPAPDAAAEERAAYTAPRTETETLLADVWAEVLGLARVGVDDPFWEIGGHSLRAMRAAARIRDALRVDVPLRLFFESPTIAELAVRLSEDEAAPGTLERTARLARLVRRMPEAEVDALLAEADGAAMDAPEDARRQALLDLLLRREGVAADGAEAPVLRRGDGPAPLSFAQERLWVMDQLQPGSAAYTMSGGLRLRGALDVDALRRAFGEIVRRHEALRTNFPTIDGAPVQAVAPAGELEIPLLDLSPLAPDAREAALRARAADESARPFDLARDPLVRIHLVRMSADEHVLLLYLHHAVADGWSMAVLYRELHALYGAFTRGEPSPLAPLPVQYADFAAWQRTRLAGPAGARQLAWWRARLAGLPEVLELPTDRPRPPVARYRGAMVQGTLSPALAGALHELSRREGTTLFMTLLAGFATLLHRWTGEADVAVGTPVAGRTRPEAEALIGDFVNTLVLRTDLSGAPTFAALLGRVREATLGAYAHQDLPFERLVDELRPERSLSHAPLFQVMFGLQNAGDTRARLDGIEVERLPVHGGTTRFDLTWSLVERDGGVQVMVEYDTDLFDTGTVQRMLAHFQALLAAAAADPAARVIDLPLLSDAEREEALSAPNRTDAPYEAFPIHRIVAAQAARTPDAVAVRGGGETLTYAELDAASNRLARHLTGLGVRRGERLAISMERSPALLVAMLATWKAGAAYVPIDPAYPEERRAYMLEDSGAAVVLTDLASADELPAGGERIVTVDALDLSLEDASAPAIPVDADDIAYVIYTSGSTGRPKGVMVPHGGVANFLASMAREPGIAADDVLVAVTSLSFDIAVLELLLSLTAGAQVVVAAREEAMDATRLAALLERSGATVMQATPATWRGLVQSGWAGSPALAILCGGEALAPDLARELLPRGRALWNLYGPTETTIWSAAQRVEYAERITLGRPIANTRLYVLDPAGQPCPASVPGELYIGGDGVVRGYLHRPGLTAERFVPDAFSASPGARLYRTGDRVRRRESAEVRECGSAGVDPESANSRTDALTHSRTSVPSHSRTSVLEFLGRMDFQVKVRGFRIELGEIEAALAEHPSVRECVVIVREDAGDARIVAYMVPEVAAPAPDVLRASLARRLPDYMLPSAYVTLEALPLTPNGKTDRRALPAPEWSAGGGYVAPRDATEEALAALWAEVLDVEQVGVHDDFFARGGHSLRGTQLVTRIRSVFGVEVPLRALFETPTVAGLARHVEQARGQETVLGADPVLPVPRDGTPLPLSFAQLRLWFLEQLEPGNARYNMAASLGLSGALDAEVLRRALQGIVNRHESLRTTYGSDAGQPVQVIHPHLPFPLPLVDLSLLPEAEREPALARMGADEVDRPIDLATGPVMRGHLFRLGDGEHVLLLVMHHVVTDGWSMGVMLRELRALYAAFLEHRPSPLAPLPVQYADYAAWQHGFLRGETLERQLGYWKAKLAGAPTVLELPSDRPRPAVQRYRGSHRRQLLEPELARQLEALARSEGATLYMVLLAAFYTLLYRYTGQRDLMVGTPVANRMRPEVEDLIGFFVNTLVLRTDLGGDPGFRELVARVRETALGAYAHQDVPFERLVEELGVPRDMSHEPLFQVMFVLQNAGVGEVDLPGVTVHHRGMERRTTKFDFTVFMWPDGDALGGWWEYNLDLWDAETVERLMGHYHTLLRALAADPDAAIGTLPLLTAPERTQVLEAWNDTAAPEPEAPCVHHLVEAQVRRTPDETAVVYEGERLTYAELNARANQLAHHLIGLGVGPDRPVGICLERSLEMTVALLAILKAGGAVVAIDPTYPEERIAFMVRDAGLAALLTQEKLAASMPQADTRVVLLDRGAAQFAHHAPEDPRVPVDARNLMYCIYTSGSTGIPKGVGVPHREFLNLLQWQWDGSGLARKAKTVQFATFGFCVSFQECFGTWAAGSTLVVIPESRRRDLEALMEVLREERVERLYVPFAALKHLSEIPWEEHRLATTLREVVTAGEPLQVTQAMRAFFRRLGAVLHNQYGSSETHVVTALPLDGDPDGWPVRAPVGRPIANARVYLLDAHLQPVPIGVPGEVCVGGEACLPRGYLGDPALTAAKLVPDPFSPVPGARMYRSGDVARQHRDGTIEVTGRLDLQIKIRGFRVEIGEVEAAIRRIAAVRDVAVVAGDNRFGEKRLVAYPVFRDLPVPAHALVDELKRRLPEYMIPTAWVPVDRLPVNANGKLDTAALPAPEEADAEGAEQYVPPRTPTEAALAEIWGEVLGKSGIGVRDNFFAVGGHSLLATQVMARVRDRCRADLPLRALFDNATIETLARAVDGAARTDAPAEERVARRSRTVRTVRLAPLPAEEEAMAPAGEPLAVGDD